MTTPECAYCRDTGTVRVAVGSEGGSLIFQEVTCSHPERWSRAVADAMLGRPAATDLFGEAA